MNIEPTCLEQLKNDTGGGVGFAEHFHGPTARKSNDNSIGNSCAVYHIFDTVMALRTHVYVVFVSCLVAAANGVKVQGNKFYDKNGKVIQLRGVSHSGSEYSCVQKKGIIEGPYDSAAVAGIKSWGNTIVRIPLNEDCWLGVNGVPSQWAGANYQKVIHDYVKAITDGGLIAILDLHWTADGSTLATKQDPMPDASHAIEFWTDVATQFANNTDVMFEIFNEPFPGQGSPQTEDWVCWRNGTCSGSTGVSFQAAGMLHAMIHPNTLIIQINPIYFSHAYKRLIPSFFCRHGTTAQGRACNRRPKCDSSWRVGLVQRPGWMAAVLACRKRPTEKHGCVHTDAWTKGKGFFCA